MVLAAYTISVVLPVGSAQGIWGLESMELSDKVVSQLYGAGELRRQRGRRRAAADGGWGKLIALGVRCCRATSGPCFQR
eukprot:COSAG06_NODE_7215_length_2583_cov_1.137681_2_plen_79_part_00